MSMRNGKGPNTESEAADKTEPMSTAQMTAVIF